MRLRLVCSLLLGLLLTAPAMAQAPRPNIIYIMADDLGNADLGYRGGQVKSPHLDSLARGGVRMESFYGMPLCTPARAALMTGRYPMRYGLQTGVIYPAHTYGLNVDELTLPQALEAAGYKTYMVGKWHLGHADKKYWPQNRGFDYFYGNAGVEVDYFTHMRGGVVDWQRNGTYLKEPGYFTTLIGDDAVRLLEKHDPAKPFFLYFASLAPHSPYEVPPEYLKRYAGEKDEKRRTYMAMISCLDDQIGRLLKVLDRRGMRKNTIILLSSDNGGLRHTWTAAGFMSGKQAQSPPPAINAPYRNGKGSLYEGGVRVVAMANWPGHLQPAVCNEPLHVVDVMPTLLALAGGKPSPSHPLDGRDMWPVLTGKASSPHEDILINVEMFRGAVRKGAWKLIKTALLPSKVELYNVVDDPGEAHNVAAQHADVVADLDGRLEAYARQMKMSLWLKAQPSFWGNQDRTVLDAGYDLDSDLVPQQKTALPKPTGGK